MWTARINPRRVITVGGTLFCAWGIGYLMQSAGQETPKALPEPVPEETVESAMQGDLLVQNGAPVELSEITLASVPIDSAMVRPPSPVTDAALQSSDTLTGDTISNSQPRSACTPSLSLAPEAAAMVGMTLEAPCQSNSRVTIHHNGMMFTEMTDENGHLQLRIPALSQEAVFILSFPEGDSLVAKTRIRELAQYDRIVVQWTGKTGLHVEDPNGFTATGGFVTRLGANDLENARIAHIFTHRVDRPEGEGSALHLHAEVTETNCGQQIHAQSLNLIGGARPVVHDIQVSFPDCQQIGDFLVLKNLLNDRKIAGN